LPWNGVLIGPGLTAFTRMPRGASSAASDRTGDRTAALVADRIESPGAPTEHPLRGPADLRHHALIHDRSMALESTFPTWRTWLQNAGHAEIDCERGLQINDSAAVI
jgi:hypothetical protein